MQTVSITSGNWEGGDPVRDRINRDRRMGLGILELVGLAKVYQRCLIRDHEELRTAVSNRAKIRTRIRATARALAEIRCVLEEKRGA
jgi:hypothetical protein